MLKWISYIITIALFGAMAIGGYFYSNWEHHEVDHSSWLVTSCDDVKAIDFITSSESFSLFFADGVWAVGNHDQNWPRAVHALPQKISEYIHFLRHLTPLRRLSERERDDLSPKELDNPSLKLVITPQGSQAKSFELCFQKGQNGAIYGWHSFNNDAIYLFDTHILDRLTVFATDFIERNVLHFIPEKVTRIQLVQSFGSSWLVEKVKGSFFFSLPGYLQNQPASNSDLNLYLHSLELLQADTFVTNPEDLKKKSLVLTLRVWSQKEGIPQEVRFYEVDGQSDVYLGYSSWLTVPFYLDVQSVKMLIKSAFDVQGRSVVQFNTGAVTSLDIAHGKTRYTVARSDNGWQLKDDKKSLQGIDMFLWRFTELKFEALPLNRLPESALQLMHCSLAGNTGKILAEITFFTDPQLPQGQCWMQNGGGMYYPVSNRLLKDLQGMFPSKPTDYRE